MTSVLYVATSNAGKLRDFAVAAESFRQAGGAGFSLLPLPGLAAIPAPAEDAPDFAGNAQAKAIAYSSHAPEAIVIADDSGLEVDALGGAPGVYSARYAERGAGLLASADAQPQAANPDTANRTHLLDELTRVLGAPQLREQSDTLSARYRCVLAAARNGVCLCLADGMVEGRILRAPRGDGGFGYDPLFYLPSLGRTMAELDAPTRLSLSHRGKALQALLPRLAVLLKQTQWRSITIPSNAPA